MSDDPAISYSPHYVAFLDVLGFKKLVMSEKPADLKKISEYFDLVQKSTETLKASNDGVPIGSIVISDSVILSISSGSDPNENLQRLRDLCIAVRDIQFGLAKDNIWMRGGISHGNAFCPINEQQVVGPAYAQAYRLEQEHAKHPRVVLDNRIIKDVKLRSAGALIKRLNESLAKMPNYDISDRNIVFQWSHAGYQKWGITQDVAMFVDYLAPAFQDCSTLAMIIENIEECIYSDNGIYPKYRWVVDYLRASCKHYINDVPSCPDKSELRKLFSLLEDL